MSEDAPQRPRLVLKPRDESAAKKAEEERRAKSANNPFGAAKPREAILAARTGKTEEEILKEAIKGERLRLRLTQSQQEEKDALEALVSEVQEQLSGEEDESARQGLQLLLQERQAAVDDLIDKFAHASLEAAQKGEILRPSERRQQQQQQQALQPSGSSGGPGYGGGGGGGGGARGGGYNSNYGSGEGRGYQGGGYNGDGGGGRNRGGFGGKGGYSDPAEGGGGGGYGKGGGFGDGGARGYQSRGEGDRPQHSSYNNNGGGGGGGGWAGGEGAGGKYNKEGTTYKEPVQASGGSYGDRPRGGGRDRDRAGGDMYLPGMSGPAAAAPTSTASVEYTSPYATYQDRF